MSDNAPALSTTSDAPKPGQVDQVSGPPADDNAELRTALDQLDTHAGSNNGAGVQQALGDVKKAWGKRIERAAETAPDDAYTRGRDTKGALK